MKRIAILGSTGSIGQSALSVVAAHPDRLRIVAMAAGENVARFVEQVGEVRPDTIAMSARETLNDAEAELRRRGQLPPRTRSGAEGLIEVATHPDADVVLFASSGTAALDAVLAAIDAGKTIAIANKEILVMAGALVMGAARDRGVLVLPVDSEHNAIHQCVHGRATSDIRRLILTASGGPFRGKTAVDLHGVTPDDALRHPTWRMGQKITIDSATLMNKGLEVIEAHWLFGVGRERIDVVVHPQSVVHSMVELIDGSIIAQMGVTDMRHAIQYALTYPARHPTSLPPLDLTQLAKLEFSAPDTDRFPCLAFAYQALRAGGTMPAVLNAANEVAVAAFLASQIRFGEIPRLISAACAAHEPQPATSLESVLAADQWAREFVTERIRSNER